MASGNDYKTVIESWVNKESSSSENILRVQSIKPPANNY